jgi:hypothetical protein
VEAELVVAAAVEAEADGEVLAAPEEARVPRLPTAKAADGWQTGGVEEKALLLLIGEEAGVVVQAAAPVERAQGEETKAPALMP